MYRIYIDDFWLIGDIIILKTKKEIKMKRITKSLPFKLLLGVCIGIIVGLLAGEGLMNIIVTVKYILGQYINFCVPLIVIGFIAPSIPKLGNNASKMLAVALVIAYVSSLGAAVFSVLTGNVIIPYLSIASSVGDLKVLPEVVFKLDIPQIMGVMSALVFSLLVGLAATWTRAVTVINLLDEFQEIVLKIVTNTVIPVLPVFIATTFCTLAYEGTITKQLPVFIQVVVIVMVGHYIWLAMLYLIAGAYAGRNPLEVLKHYGAAYITAVGTMSSAATLAVALRCARKSKVLRNDMIDFGIPLFANIHLCGSVLTETFFVMVVSKILYGDIPDMKMMVLFCILLGIFAIGAPGVPGGTVMASLGLITGILGFNETGTALILILRDVIYFESCGSRVHIVLKGKLYKFYKKLDDVEKEISVNYSIPFIRIHKSYLVNFQQIRKVGYTEVETKDGRILNISDTYKKDVRARYSKLLWDGDV